MFIEEHFLSIHPFAQTKYMYDYDNEMGNDGEYEAIILGSSINTTPISSPTHYKWIERFSAICCVCIKGIFM